MNENEMEKFKKQEDYIFAVADKIVEQDNDVISSVVLCVDQDPDSNAQDVPMASAGSVMGSLGLYKKIQKALVSSDADHYPTGEDEEWFGTLNKLAEKTVTDLGFSTVLVGIVYVVPNGKERMVYGLVGSETEALGACQVAIHLAMDAYSMPLGDPEDGEN
jgi:hypothetical protein